MDYSLSVYLSSLLSKKLFPMQSILTDNQTQWTPPEWRQTLARYDPQQHYVISHAYHFKERKPFPDFQHEFVLLVIQPGVALPQPAIASAVVKISRSIRGNGLLSRLGLYGTADDTITVLGHNVDIEALVTPGLHKMLHHLTWDPHPETRPSLADASIFISHIHQSLPHYSLLRTSCCTFARALFECIHLAFDGGEEPQRGCFLTRQSYFLSVIPSGTSIAQDLARYSAGMYTLVHDTPTGGKSAISTFHLIHRY